MEMNNKLQVRNLRISFRTVNGKVQAVRDVSFDLNEGETLAIVGESGSGKSVTSRAILGILASNAIVEGGEIIYDGKDLMKIPEDEFHKIRGDKIAMIFQDPMSSLNPIMKIGRQLTEAMLLKNKANRDASRKEFNSTLKLLTESIIASKGFGEKSPEKAAIEAKSKKFDEFEYVHISLEQKFNDAREAAVETGVEIDNLLFEIDKKVVADIVRSTEEITRLALASQNRFVVREGTTDIVELAARLNAAAKAAKKAKTKDFSGMIADLNAVKAITQAAAEYDVPNFFSLGYHIKFVSPEIPELPVAELNRQTRRELDDGFMMDYIADAETGMLYSHTRSAEAQKAAVEELKKGREIFLSEQLDRKACEAEMKRLTGIVEGSINRLSVHKDSNAYTFASSLRSAINYYYESLKRNDEEQKRFDKQTAKHDRKSSRGKEPDWKVIPADIRDIELAKQSMVNIIDRLADQYERSLKSRDKYDAQGETVQLIDYLKEKASSVVYKVTPRMAKNKALKLLEEVGINDPRARYNQYPFEFSGGMRQRIVIAIALAANPDILICDEPTTALDVTIQAQILELINQLKRERNLTVIFITHDLGVVANMADRIAVMYAGKIVEYGTAEDVFYAPAHPYSWALLSSMPDLDTNERLESIPGTPPNMIYPPKGDAFAERNKYAMEIDFEAQPPMFQISETHFAATWLLHPNAPKVEIPKIITDRIARMKKLGGGEN